jgi:predicted nucleic acid-binding Zn finger protein
MEFQCRYHGRTTVESNASSTDMSLAPDTLRQPTYFSGELRRHLPFREAISALHDVVVSDLSKPPPRDTDDYKAWAQEEEDRLVEEAIGRQAGIAEQIAAKHRELIKLRSARQSRWAPFYDARQRYFNYLYKRDYAAWVVLDPVITVHPDQVFFECLSRDESTYGRLSVGYDAFQAVGEHAIGTTNVDYSDALYDEFQKIRTYKTTRFQVDPGGFDVSTAGEDDYTEVKIDLPDSWVRGFLQVSSAMTLDAVVVRLHPMDIHNLCFVLRRKRELSGPRSLRWQLEPGQPLSVVIEPWNIEVTCPRSIYEGKDAHEIRTWGRRRLHTLERLIPIADHIDVHLLGYGMPTFFVARMGDMSFTLGLSGWTANDWSREGQFDLLAPRADVDVATTQHVFDALGGMSVASADELGARAGVDRATAQGAMQRWVQAGRAIYDLDQRVWRKRELSREPLPSDALRFASEREAEAQKLVYEKKAVLHEERAEQGGRVRLLGEVGDKRSRMRTELVLDGDERLVDARCTCNHFQQNRLRKGPCAHVLAVRMLKGQAQERKLFGIW